MVVLNYVLQSQHRPSRHFAEYTFLSEPLKMATSTGTPLSKNFSKGVEDDEGTTC